MIAKSLSLTDLDEDHVITGAQVEITNPSSGDVISLTETGDLNIESESNYIIKVNGSGDVLSYKVAIITMCLCHIPFLATTSNFKLL